jgi:hypothetical protein
VVCNTKLSEYHCIAVSSNHLTTFRTEISNQHHRKRSWTLSKDEPFELIIRCLHPQAEEAEYKKFWRNGLFSMAKHGLPRVLMDCATSTSSRPYNSPARLKQMLLHGASIVRFANTRLDEFREKKDFVLVAYFIRYGGRTTRHTLFQDWGQSVSDLMKCYVLARLISARLSTKPTGSISTRSREPSIFCASYTT